MEMLLTHTSNYTYDEHALCQGRMEGTYLWMYASVITFLFGVPGTSAVFLDMIQKGRKRSQFTPYDIFLINLTVIDGLFLVINLLEMCNYFLWVNSIFAAFVDFSYTLNVCGRPLFTTCICVDCYLAVVHPIVYRTNKSLTHRVLIAVAVWTVTFIFGYICLIQDKIPSKLYLVFVVILTLPITAFCDATILWTLRTSNPTGGSIHPMKKRAFQIIINNTVVTFTSYLPPVIAALVSECLNLESEIYFCLVLTPVLSSMLAGNAVSPILHLNNVGKLDWLKSLCKN